MDPTALLTPENYSHGFLVDDELLAGVTADPTHPDRYTAFILSQTTGEYVGFKVFETLSAALENLNAVKREWKYESTKSCSGGNCTTGSCGVGACGTESCPKGLTTPCEDA